MPGVGFKILSVFALICGSSPLFAQDFYRLDLAPEQSIPAWSTTGILENGKFLQSEPFKPSRLDEIMIAEKIGNDQVRIGDQAHLSDVVLIRWYEFQRIDGVNYRKQTDQYYLILKSDFDLRFKSANGPDSTVIRGPGRNDKLLDIHGRPLICRPKNQAEELSDFLSDAAQKTQATPPPAPDSAPAPATPTAQAPKPELLPGEDLSQPTDPIADQAEFDKRMKAKEARQKYYNALLNKFSEYRLAPRLLNSIQSKVNLDEITQRPLRLDAIRGFLIHAKNDPFFAGELGKKRLNDLVSLLTISTEFLSEKDGTPFNLEAAYTTIHNRSDPSQRMEPFYCNIALEYCPDPQAILRGQGPGWMDQSMMGVALSGNVNRTKEESAARLSSAKAILKRILATLEPKTPEKKIIEKIKEMKEPQIIELLGKLLSREDQQSFQKNPNDPALVKKVNEALWQKIMPAPGQLSTTTKDTTFGFQYSAWNFTNPNLTFILLMSHPEGRSLRPLEWASLQRGVRQLAARDTGLVTIESSNPETKHPELDGFNAALYYLSPGGMTDGGDQEKEWNQTKFQIHYPVVIRNDLQENGEVRTLITQKPFRSKQIPNLMKLWRNPTKAERKIEKDTKEHKRED